METDTPATSVTEHRFPCPACGSDLRFSPGGEKLICDHCGHEDALVEDTSSKSEAVRELDYQRAVADQLPAAEIEETRVLSCDSCGAQVEFDSVTHAKECPFCASPVVTDTGTHRHIKPKGLLPFGLNESSAREAMGDWLGGLWFAPNGLQEYAQKGRKMQGIYVPYWTYDADTQSDYHGQRGIEYQESRTVTDNEGNSRTETVTKVRWTNVSGRVSRWFDDVLVLASRSLPQRYTDALEPWDLASMEPYRPEYIAGFRAEGYVVALEEGYTVARDKMDIQIRRDIKFDIGGDRQRISSVDTDVWNVTFKHVLLPVWLAAYKYRGKTYRFVVNGRTGRVQGERPWSVWKITFAVIASLVIAGGIGYAIALQQGSI